jgi:hypothetical protein
MPRGNRGARSFVPRSKQGMTRPTRQGRRLGRASLLDRSGKRGLVEKACPYEAGIPPERNAVAETNE